jgi:hypothetical protein
MLNYKQIFMCNSDRGLAQIERHVMDIRSDVATIHDSFLEIDPMIIYREATTSRKAAPFCSSKKVFLVKKKQVRVFCSKYFLNTFEKPSSNFGLNPVDH